MKVNLSEYEYFTEEVKYLRVFTIKKKRKRYKLGNNSISSSSSYTNDFSEPTTPSEDRKNIFKVLKLPEIAKNKLYEETSEEKQSKERNDYSNINKLPTIVKSNIEKKKSHVIKKLRFDVDQNDKPVSSQVRLYTPPYEDDPIDSDIIKATITEIPKLVRENTIFKFKPTNNSRESCITKEEFLLTVNTTEKVQNETKQEKSALSNLNSNNEQKNNIENKLCTNLKNEKNNKHETDEKLSLKEDKNLKKAGSVTANSSLGDIKLEKRLSISNNVMQRTRYPWMVKTYLDQRWHNGRKQKFYHNLEQQQKFTQQERKLNKLEKQKQKDYAFSRQRVQLLELRNKYENEKERRIQTQHVKLSLIDEEDKVNRSVYGLPNKKDASKKKKKLKLTNLTRQDHLP